MIKAFAEMKLCGKKLFSKLFVKSFIVFAVVLLLWEIILQNVIFKSPGSWQHPIMGRIYYQGVHVDGREGYSRSNVNQLGMRNSEIHDKKSDEYRILVLGDSFTYGAQCSDDVIYTVRLKKFLNSYFPNLNVVNAGRDGTSPSYYIALSDFFRQEINPDFVVIQINEGDLASELDDVTKNFYLAEKDNDFEILENKDAGNKHVDSLIKLFSTLSAYRETAGKISVLQRGKDQIDNLLRSQHEESSFPRDYNKIISWTIQAMKAQYPNMVVIYIPIIDYEHTDHPISEVEALVDFYTKQYQVPCINMRDDFVSYFKKNQQPAHGFNNTQPGAGHTNAIGNELMAEALTNYFVNEVLQ